MVLLGRGAHLGTFQQPSHEEMELAKAMTVAGEALMLNRKGEFFYGTAAEVLNEKNISYSFDVQVVVNEFQHEGSTIRSIVPVALQGETA